MLLLLLQGFFDKTTGMTPASKPELSSKRRRTPSHKRSTRSTSSKSHVSSKRSSVTSLSACPVQSEASASVSGISSSGKSADGGGGGGEPPAVRANYNQPRNPSTKRISTHSAPPKYPQVQSSNGYRLDDLSGLPKPRMLVSRDSPWVYRYKAKRNMNELSRIIASKPAPFIEYHFLRQLP